LLLSVSATQPARAQGPFSFLNGGEYRVAAAKKKRRYVSRRRYRSKARKKVAVKPSWYPDKNEKDPVQIIISLPDQKATVYQGDKILTTSRVSTGKKGHDTPSGVFSILQKNRHHRSNIYGGASMPFMQRLTWSGVALHASNSVPNRPASHGCVRLPPSFAGQLFRFTQRGAHVVIARRSTAPAEIVHDKLFQPSPPAPKDYDVAESERTLIVSGIKLEEKKKSDDPIRILITRNTGRERLTHVQKLLNELEFGAGDEDGWMGRDTASAIKRFQQTYGMEANGFVSDELIARLHEVAGMPEPSNGRIYVRQNFRQLFDATARIKEPEKLLGSHIMTAMYFEPGSERTRWLVVSLSPKAKETPQREAAAHPEGTMTDQAAPDLPAPETSTAMQALDRIEIPDDIRRRIEQILTPGSSLAISDEGLSKETHPKGTDFVLLNN